MKQLTRKQWITIALVLIVALVGAYFWGYRPNRTETKATAEEIQQLKEEENKDLKKIGKKSEEKEEEKKLFEITSFSISSNVEEIEPGNSINFTGYFDGMGEFSREITWSIQGRHNENTKIGEDGVLQVAKEEKEPSLSIRGISTADPTKTAEKPVVIKVSQEQKVAEKPKNKEELKQQMQEAQANITEEEKEKTQADAEAEKQKAIAATSGGLKDKYQTSAIPAGKPKPVEPENAVVNKEVEKTATISIRCDTILDNMDLFNMDKIDMLPVDGVILSTINVTFYEGESVFDILQRVTRDNKIHMEFVFTPVYNSAYIEGIHNLYEFDCGELSGWMYNVNGWFPNYGCSRYIVEDGDVINWVYTCELGKDVGDNSMTQ